MISGWPAVVGVIVWDNSPEASYDAGKYLVIGYIYVGDYKIGFSSDYRDENALEALKHLKITAEPGLDMHFLDYRGKPFPKDHLTKEQAECEVECDAEYNESQLGCGIGQCGDKSYYNICLNDCQTSADSDRD